MSGTDLESKRLEVLKNAVPTIDKVMILHDPSMGSTGLSEVKAGARSLGLELFVVETMPNSQKPSPAWPPRA
jgi:putative tryptophan/tyrosine transport system substrate-binding protein